jgi:hypothetical protein
MHVAIHSVYIHTAAQVGIKVNCSRALASLLAIINSAQRMSIKVHSRSSAGWPAVAKASRWQVSSLRKQLFFHILRLIALCELCGQRVPHAAESCIVLIILCHKLLQQQQSSQQQQQLLDWLDMFNVINNMTSNLDLLRQPLAAQRAPNALLQMM